MKRSKPIPRREFIKKGAGLAGAASVFSMGGFRLSSAFAAKAKSDETYVMVSFLSGIEWWIPCFNGMKDAAKHLGVRAEYTGTEQYDAMEQARVMEQVMATNPAGILIAPQNPEALKPSIDKAIDMGIPLVTFGSDSPQSKRPLFLAIRDYSCGVQAAHRIAKVNNGKGKVMVVTTIGQSNMMDRAQGLIDTIEKEYPEMKLAATVEEGGSYEFTAARVTEVIQANQDLVGVWVCGSTGPGAVRAAEETGKLEQIEIVTMDIDAALIELIEQGKVSATIVQGCWNMGFYGLMFAHLWKHDLVKPVPDWKKAGISPLPPYLDCGVYTANKDNVKYFKTVNIPT